MSPSASLGQLLHSYFLDHLIAIKGLRPGSVRSYRDTIRLLLLFVAADKRCKLTRLQLDDLTFERVVAFLRHLEHDRSNSIRTRNQRLAAVRSLFEYIVRSWTSVIRDNDSRVPTPPSKFWKSAQIAWTENVYIARPSHSPPGTLTQTRPKIFASWYSRTSIRASRKPTACVRLRRGASVLIARRRSAPLISGRMRSRRVLQPRTSPG